MEDGAVAVDGALIEDVWKRTVFHAVARYFKSTDDQVEKKFFGMAYTDVGLYIGIRCMEPHPDNLTVNIHSHDGEVFLDVGRTRLEYYQFAFNTAGTQFELFADKYGRDNGWNGREISRVGAEQEIGTYSAAQCELRVDAQNVLVLSLSTEFTVRLNKDAVCGTTCSQYCPHR